MQLDGKRLGRFRPCLLLPVVLPIPHQAFKARSLWHQMNVGEGSRQNEGVSLVEALALKDATGARRVVGQGGSRVAGASRRPTAASAASSTHAPGSRPLQN